jgi:DNA-binding NarL/FixJ family response regulator
VGLALVGDSGTLQSILQRASAAKGGFRLVVAALTGSEALCKLPKLGADIAVIAADLPDLCGVACARELISRQPDLVVVLVAGIRNSLFIRRARSAGVGQYWLEPLRYHDCLAALQFMACGLRAPASRPASVLQASPGAAPDPKRLRTDRLLSLSPREQHLIAYMERGLLYKEIEAALGLSHSLLRKLQRRIYRKLDVSNRGEAVSLWCRGNIDGG